MTRKKLFGLEGNLFTVLEKSINFCKEHLELRAEIKGLYREENWEIPLKALREAIINALIHRDYRDIGETYIKIYDSEIVIANPGKLPQELSIQKLYKEHESKPRNPLLATTFYYAGLIDKWGRGISNIIKELKENKLPAPEFEESGGSFRIKFKRVKKITREITREKTREKIITLIRENPKITTKEISERLNISIKGVEWQITKLKKEGIKRMGQKEVAEKVAERLTQNQQKILRFVRENNYITIIELARSINLSRKSVQENIVKLKEKKLLRRIGPDKGGHWEINH